MIAAERPPACRVILALVLAPAVAAAVGSATTLFDGLDNGTWLAMWGLFAVAGGFLPAFLLGVPAWFAFSRRVRPRFRTAMLAGGIIATLPWLLLLLFGGNPDNAGADGVVTVVDGVRTAAGWTSAAKTLALIFALGALGGVVFRVVAYGWRR